MSFIDFVCMNLLCSLEPDVSTRDVMHRLSCLLEFALFRCCQLALGFRQLQHMLLGTLDQVISDLFGKQMTSKQRLHFVNTRFCNVEVELFQMLLCEVLWSTQVGSLGKKSAGFAN